MNRAAHWDEVYRTRVSGDRSWSQRRADVSLELIEEAFGEGRAAVLDVGGGASPLAGDLLAR